MSWSGFEHLVNYGRSKARIWNIKKIRQFNIEVSKVIGVFPDFHPFVDGIFPETIHKPSSYWGTHDLSVFLSSSQAMRQIWVSSSRLDKGRRARFFCRRGLNGGPRAGGFISWRSRIWFTPIAGWFIILIYNRKSYKHGWFRSTLTLETTIFVCCFFLTGTWRASPTSHDAFRKVRIRPKSACWIMTTGSHGYKGVPPWLRTPPNSRKSPMWEDHSGYLWIDPILEPWRSCMTTGHCSWVWDLQMIQTEKSIATQNWSKLHSLHGSESVEICVESKKV